MSAARRTKPDAELPLPDVVPDRLSSGEQAARYIRRLVFDGHLKPGDRVPQDAIAARLGFSRIPVREALLSLEREGWVTIRPHRGAFIGALDETVVRDHYDLYGQLYSFAVLRAAERATPEQLDELADVQRLIRSADGPAEAWRLNRLFHDTVLQIAGSPRLGAVVRALSGLVPGNFFELVPGSIDVEKQGTAAIVRALRRRDGQRAAEAYVRTMRRQGDLVVSLFRAKGILPMRRRASA